MKVLIIEDEPAAAKRLQRMLAKLDPSIQVLDILTSVENAVQWLKANVEPELIFMDIQLEDGQSFEILEEIDIASPVIFTTAYDQFAIQAFRYNSIDYLLKPYKEEELQKSYLKYKSLFRQNPAQDSDYNKLLAYIQKEKTPTQERLLVQIGTQLHSVSLKDVAYFYTQLKSVYLITFDGKKYPIDQKLDHLEKILDHVKFFRINRQFIIHINAIDKMFAYSKSRVKLILSPQSDQEIIVSTIRSPEFKKWLAGIS